MLSKEKIELRIKEIEETFRLDEERKRRDGNPLYGMDRLTYNYLDGQLTALKDVLCDRL